MAKKLPRTLHIYQFSRLVHALPGAWNRILEAMEEDKDRAFRYYQPCREAIVRYCACQGKRRESIVARLQREASSIPAGRGQYPLEDNLRAFKIFEERFYPKIGRFICGLLREPHMDGVEFEGLRMLGLPHLAVRDQTGENRYVFLYPSNWKKADLDAYLEVLSEICRDRFEVEPSAIWCMNLRTGKTYNWKPSSRIRTRCEDAARHYVRLRGA